VSEFKCGYVALIGRSNAGKSTLLNGLLGTKLAITSSKPQTTRDRIVGICNAPGVQAVLVDTPGIHRAWTQLNRAMVGRAIEVIREVDLVCWVVDLSVRASRVEAGREVLDDQDDEIVRVVREAGRPVILVVNKLDVVPSPLVLPVIDAWRTRLDLSAAVPTSALTGDGLPVLVDELRLHLPVSEPLFPEDHWAQVTERFLVAEIVREKVFHLTEQEIPYSTFVEVERFDESGRDSEGIVRIYARIAVERSSQKGIVIGRGGEMLKRIGTLARKELQEVLGCRVYLELFVNVEKDWTKSARGLRRAGFEQD